jgi:hypothetical protein
MLVNFGNYDVQHIPLQVSTNTRLTFNSISLTPTLKSDKRGYVALVYSGTARSFSANFESHIVNLMAGCPYTVHLFIHTYINDNRFPSDMINSSYATYLSVNSTLAYFEGYISLDNEHILFRDAVKANVFEQMPLQTLTEIYNDTYTISMKRFPGHPPIPSIYYMWHSQRRSEELRQKYMTVTGIDYKWTFRMRHDAVYYTNWWQRAFNVQVYNPINPVHKTISHDVFGDWGVRHTRLYDMVYEPKLQMNNVLYVPFGWAYGGYNDQFAAMSSMNANHYFTRIFHVDRMLREDKVHPETSIRLVALWNNMIVNNVDGTVCYDIVRTSLNNEQDVATKTDQRNRFCSYKKSGNEDCNILCPKIEEINKALRNTFVRDETFWAQNVAINVKQIKSLLIHHLTRVNNDTIQIDYNASSFYYFYRYATSKDANKPCLSNTWPKDQSNIYAMQHLPFVLRASDRTKIAMYNKHLACGSPIDIPI